MKIRFAHIVSPFRAAPGSEHAIAQPITFSSMLAAADRAEMAELWAAVLPGEEDLVPPGFRTLVLQRSLADVATFSGARPLPLITDLLSALEANSDADYFIYTNIDIGLQPEFYNTVAGLIQEGYDSIVINRRGLPSHFNSVTQLPDMYRERGADHPGYDCFVFKREHAARFILGNICIGIPRFERSFVLNLIRVSGRILFLDKAQLTFHIGQKVLKVWGDKSHYTHNQAEYLAIRKKIFSELRISRFPYWNEFILRRYWKWLMNPNFSFPDNLFLEWRYRLFGR